MKAICLPCKLLILVLLVWEGQGIALAQSVDPATADRLTETVLARLGDAIPNISFSDIRVTELADYFRVDVEQGPTLYIAEDGSHFFSGSYYSVGDAGLVNITEQENRQIRVEQLALIPQSEKIIFSPRGEMRAALTVFTDVTCTFCRRQHSEIEQFLALGIEVQYLAFPRSGIERNGQLTAEYRQTARAWCADNPKLALTALKLGDSLAGSECTDNPVREHYQLGLEFGVDGTPAAVLPDGTLVVGYRTAADFALLLGLDSP